jgi:branched-subunit amino acid transport protein
MGIGIWLVIIAAGIITYLIRLSFIIALERLKIPDWFRRGLRYVPPAVLSAIILPELANWNGETVNLTWDNPQLIAGIIAIMVAWRTRNVVLTLAAGMVCFLVLYLWL